MMPLRRFWTSCVVLGVVGCADGTVGTIDYELSGGFDGQLTTVHIDPTGEMTRTVERGTTETDVLDPTELADLHRKVNDAWSPLLDAQYRCRCADDFIHTISVHIDDGEYTVVASDIAKYPGRLRPLINTLWEMSRAPIDPD
jgi:hypothetical protein